MAKRTLKAGATSRIEFVFIQDSSKTDGSGISTLTNATSGWKAYYVRPGSAPVSISLVSVTVTGAFTSGGFVATDTTNQPGLYRIDVPDAVFAAGVDHAVVTLLGPTNVAPIVLEYDLVAYDPQDTVRLGLTALPNVAQGTAGQLATADASARVDVGKWLGTAAATPNTAGVPLVDVGRWLGTVVATPNTAGVPLVDVTRWLGTTVVTPATAGVPSVGLTSSERNSAADAWLDRALNAGSNAGTDTGRTVRNALRYLRNKVSISGSTLTVTQEDDSTAGWTAAVTGTTGADPVTAIDPT
jgi:hypothetical protein